MIAAAQNSEKYLEENAKRYMRQKFGFWTERWRISPEGAREILNDMGENRKIKTTGVARYASSISAGDWALSPQGLIFDEEGHLIDGQHRLEAVIKSGTPVDFVVTLGVPKDTPIDKGITRSDADSMRIRGILDANLANRSYIALTNALFREVLTSAEYNGITEDDKAAFIKKHANEIAHVCRASSRGSEHPICKRAGTQAAMLAAMMCGVDGDVVEAFCVSINTLQFDKSNSPAKALYCILNSIKLRGNNLIKTIEGATEEAIFDTVNGKSKRGAYKGDKHPYTEMLSSKDMLVREEES